MLSESRELVMIDAHWRLVGFDVGAISVIVKSGPEDVLDAANAGSGNAEETRTKAMTPSSAPCAVPFIVEERIFGLTFAF